MEAHPNEVIAERAVIDAVIEALDPTAGLRIVVNLMFRSAAFSLGGPELEEVVFDELVTVIFGPFPESFPARTVHGAETAQLAELLRELRDFR
jgi:hypothetical protein